MALDLSAYAHMKPGQRVRVQCCAKTTTAIVSRERGLIRAFCFKCGETSRKDLPSSLSEDIATIASSLTTSASPQELNGIAWPDGSISQLPREARLWLAERSISPELSSALSLRWSIGISRLVLPCFDPQSGSLIYWQGRALETWRKPKYLTKESAQASNVVFSSVKSGITPLRTSPHVLVEDIVSAVRVGHVLPSHALLGTALTDGKIAALLSSGASDFVTWFDNDDAGRKARKQSARRLPLVGLRVRHVRTELDPKAYSNRRIEEIIDAP